MADEMDTPSAPSAPSVGLGGRQKRAFLLAAVLVLGIGLAIKLLGKQGAASAPTGTVDTSGVSAPVPVSVYNYYSTSGGSTSGGSTSGGSTSGGSTSGGSTSGGILPTHGRNPIDPLGGGHNGLLTGGGLGPSGFHGRNPIDPLGSGPNGLIRPPALHPRNPIDPPVAPVPIGSDPAHYH